jgi:hypothetical protein
MNIEDLHHICNSIIGSDQSIRYVGISNKMGKQVAYKYREGLTPLISPKEIEMLAIESVLRMNTRKDFQTKLGKPIYSFTLYEKVKRATIALESEEYPILMVSFDSRSDHESIIMNKVVPMIRQIGL